MSDTAELKANLRWYYKKPVMPILVFAWILMEKMVAHVYLVTLIYAGIPMKYSYGFAAFVGMLGVYLVWKGVKIENNDVRASWFGFMGGAFIWTGALEMWHHAMGTYNLQPVAMKDGEAIFVNGFDGMTMPTDGSEIFFMGEHAFLQSSSMLCIILFIMMFMNKDVTCRMLMWFRKVLGLKPGTPTKAMRPQHARVACTEYLFVNWFMYVIMLAVLDERTLGADHIVTVLTTVGIAVWAAYIIYKQTQQREAGLAIRYAIAVVGVTWFLPEMTTLWGWFVEPWVNFYQSTTDSIIMLVIITLFITLSVIFYKTPVNPKTGKSL